MLSVSLNKTFPYFFLFLTTMQFRVTSDGDVASVGNYQAGLLEGKRIRLI